jgi:hypothetical protein
MNVNPLTDPDALRNLLGEAPAAEEAAPSAADEPADAGGLLAGSRGLADAPLLETTSCSPGRPERVKPLRCTRWFRTWTLSW